MRNKVYGILFAGVMLACSGLQAETINQISFVGGDTVSADGTVHFLDYNGSKAGNADAAYATGAFAPFDNAKASTTFNDFNYLSSTGNFSLWKSVNGAKSLEFTVTDFSYTTGAGLDIFGDGFYTLITDTGEKTIENGKFDLTTQMGGGKVTFSDTNSVAATPEPSSLIMLGTGLLGMAGAARRRFMTA